MKLKEWFKYLFRNVEETDQETTRLILKYYKPFILLSIIIIILFSYISSTL